MFIHGINDELATEQGTTGSGVKLDGATEC